MRTHCRTRLSRLTGQRNRNLGKTFIVLYEAMLGHGLDENVVVSRDNHKIIAIEVNGNKIDILVFNYSDRILVVVTQFGKLGSLLKVRRNQPAEGENREDVYEVNTLFGDDPLEYHVTARALAECMQTTKPILFGIALRDLTFPTLQAIRSALLENKFW